MLTLLIKLKTIQRGLRNNEVNQARIRSEEKREDSITMPIQVHPLPFQSQNDRLFST